MHTILKERLDASIAIYKAKKSKEILLSNTKDAVAIMKAYLVEKGIPKNDIKLDNTREQSKFFFFLESIFC